MSGYVCMCIGVYFWVRFNQVTTFDGEYITTGGFNLFLLG
jgi:hypothetical protein